MTTWRAALLGIVLGASTLVHGCAAPTLPLPPPTALVSAPDATGLVTITGTADPRAYILSLNNATDTGVIGHVMPDGHYSLRLAAATGDEIWVWQELNGQQSPPDIHDVP